MESLNSRVIVTEFLDFVPIIGCVRCPFHVIVREHSRPIRHYTLDTTHQPVCAGLLLRVRYVRRRPLFVPASELRVQLLRHIGMALEQDNYYEREFRIPTAK